MLKVWVRDAARDTFQTSGLDNQGYSQAPDHVALAQATQDRVSFNGSLDLPFQDYRIVYFGELQPKTNPEIWNFGIERYQGNISQVREYYDGELAFRTVFTPEVRAQQYVNDWATRFYSGVNFRGNSFDNEFHGENGTDVLRGFGGDDFLVSGDGDDQFFGGTGNDRISAGDGDDVLKGGAGGDTLLGMAGADALIGGWGEDFLWGGKGRDLLNGGADADIFYFNHINETKPGRGQRDVIRDFTPGEDILDLSGIDARSGHSGDDSFRYIGEADFTGRSGQLRYCDGLVLGDVDGDAQPDFAIDIRGTPDLGADDFQL